ncbi:hypothetical protein [Vibrio palustris]|uniref:Uncharacterized protein n=1 Tax=Vibrio palustris TaxID=1918946 RepID=A0A1R4B2U6_9VIBR|nr:hypothetical protein [Vibrio palustris]SJL83242.1 hypothetical protein VPAL9027_01205 [Vibrio palustris]
MKRTSNTYRLNLIKQVANKAQEDKPDPMAEYINSMLSKDEKKVQRPATKGNFSGVHFDEHIGGWVSDRWTGQ